MEDTTLRILTWLVQMSEPVILNWFWSKIATPVEERKKMQAIGIVFLCGYISILSVAVSKVGSIPFLAYSLNNLSAFVNVWYAVIFYKISKKKATGFIIARSIVDAIVEYAFTFFVIYSLKINAELFLDSTTIVFADYSILKISDICVLLVLIKLREKYRKNIENSRIFYLLLISYVSFYIAFFECYYMLTINSMSLVRFLTAVILWIATEVIVLSYSLLIITKNNKEEERYQETIQYVQNQLAMYNDIQIKLDENQKRLHDIGNDLCTIELLFHNHMQEKGMEYLHQLIPEIKKGMVVGMGTSVIYIILYGKRLRALEKNIELVCGIEVDNIIMPLQDLNAIITNMLDNAMEACEKIGNRKKRWIKFKVYVSDESVVIECENTYIGKLEMNKSGGFITSKEDKVNHGFGLKRIEECAVTNGGNFMMEYTEEIFTVRVFFDKERADQKEEA